ncbi:MAG: hypothetical protein QMD05_09265, partial [Candidatus Brocadiaceae bacterium]|nr:hypothetical protein [Candidatus Brocadiaceae bacterium]
PVGDVLLKCLDGVLSLRNSGDTAYASMILNALTAEAGLIVKRGSTLHNSASNYEIPLTVQNQNTLAPTMEIWGGVGAATLFLEIDANGKVGIGAGSSPDGKLHVGSGHITLDEITAPANSPADKARLFVRDNGAGKTQLCAIFSTGAVQVLATEP